MKYTVSVKEMPIADENMYIYGKAFLPQEKNGRLPAVILSHGYNYFSGYLEDAAFALAETGLLAYTFDFRGGAVNSRSSGSSTDMSISSEIADLNRVIEFIGNMDITDKSRIFLYGESQGGFVSALTADERIKGLYLLYPAFCIPDNWKNRKISDTVIFMGMRLSNKYCDGLPDYDVFEHIGKYTGKVKIYHGDADSVVDISYSEKVCRSFKNASPEIFPDEGHGFSPAARKKLIDNICNDISQYI